MQSIVRMLSVRILIELGMIVMGRIETQGGFHSARAHL